MNIPALDCNIEQAMKYVYKNRHGYMRDLKPFGENVINSMKSAGFLKTGWTKEAETFSATQMLQKYVKIVWNKIDEIKND